MSCGANIAPEWKFCIHCGTVAPTVSPRRYDARGRSQGLPAAIRPEPAHLASTPAGRSTRLDVPLLLGIVLGVAGVALIVYLAIMTFGPQ